MHFYLHEETKVKYRRDFALHHRRRISLLFSHERYSSDNALPMGSFRAGNQISRAIVYFDLYLRYCPLQYNYIASLIRPIRMHFFTKIPIEFLGRRFRD